METIYNRADDVMSRFDFEKVHAYMKLINHQWNAEIPSIQQLRDTAYSMLLDAQTNNYQTSRTGGFLVTYNRFKSGTKGLSLSFYIEFSETELKDW